MALRTGTITQQTRASRDHQKSIADIREEIIRKRNQIKALIYLLNTLIPKDNTNENLQPSKWDHVKHMAKEQLEKLKAVAPPFVRPTRHRVRSQAAQGGDTLTQQHMKQDCDINLIIKRHTETGDISHLNPNSPLYMDCTGVRDLQGAIHLVEEAEDNFATLPSAVRKACRNDPVEFVEMLYTDEGTKELGEAGLEYGLEEPQKDGTAVPHPKPKTTPAQKIIPGTEPVGDPTPTETTVPEGGK